MDQLQKLEKYGYSIPPTNINSIQLPQILKQIQAQLEQTKDVLWSVLDSEQKLPAQEAFHAVSAEISSLMVQTAKFHRAIISDQIKTPKNDFQEEFQRIKEDNAKRENEILAINKNLNIRVQVLESQNLELEKLNILLKSNEVKQPTVQSQNIALQRLVQQQKQMEKEVESQISNQIFLQTAKSELPFAVSQVLTLLEEEAAHEKAEVQSLRSQLDDQSQQLQLIKEIYEKEKSAWWKEKAEMKSKWSVLWSELAEKMM
ncbi:hypothetical protein SS50377_27976 [Spironucleus salmonicida]|uniref:Uncharacterized protein n=1 Tax=Spironucleus salmonicida TaxID=348837 RepID=V6LP81_9EUKA|nr:hypothetical protein SS50377_27976 [Spironucleus salmonicida]|eukprot:EST42534.1 Hypothetical protein SS50377_17847 [Spironucleus salmonicida]